LNDRSFILGIIVLVSILTAATALKTDYNPHRSVVEMWVYNYTDNVPVGKDITIGLRMKSTDVRKGKIDIYDELNKFATFDVNIDQPRHYDIGFPAISRGKHTIRLKYYEDDLIGKGSKGDPYYIIVRVNVV